jgi:uncharacterized protein (TIGR03000 family)
MLAAVVVCLGSTVPCAGHGGGGHGGGAGHAFAGNGGFRGCPYGFRGGYGYGFYRYPGFYGYPWYGFGLGLGLGYGLGYGYGYGYPYYPYVGSYPIYITPSYGPPSSAPCPPAGPGATAGSVPGAPLRLTDSDMLLSIRVPPDAIVQINGEQTSQNGPRREYLSSGLSPGRTYTFVVTAQWTGPEGKAWNVNSAFTSRAASGAMLIF